MKNQSQKAHRLLKTTAVFVLLFVGFYLGLSALVHRVHWSGRRLALHLNPLLARTGGQEALMTNDWQPNRDWDIVVVGSSHAYRGYDPRFFRSHGWSLFNAGSSAQHPLVSLELLKTFLPATSKKPLIVLDVFDKILEMDGKESNGRMMMNAKQWSIANGILIHDFDVLSLNTFVGRCFANHSQLEMEVKDYVEQGYCGRSTALQAFPAPVQYTFEGNPNTIAQFEACLSWLQENGLSFVLVSHPMPMQQGFAEYHAPAAQALNTMAKAHNTVFIDYTTAPTFVQELNNFSDATHLNQSGVEVFNAQLLDTLVALGYINTKQHTR